MSFLAKGKVNRGSSCNSNRLRALNRIVGPGARPARTACYSSAYRAFNIAEKRAALVFRRFLALGFSKRRCRRTCCRVCSRSSFFLSRRRAFSTGSPFFSLISLIIYLFAASFRSGHGCLRSMVSRRALVASGRYRSFEQLLWPDLGHLPILIILLSNGLELLDFFLKFAHAAEHFRQLLQGDPLPLDLLIGPGRDADHRSLVRNIAHHAL